MICGKKVPTKITALICQTVLQPAMLCGCETWTTKYEKGTATVDVWIVLWAMVVSVQEHENNEEILEEALLELIVMVREKEC